MCARRASLVQDPKQNVRRSVSGGSAADEMAAAVAAMDMEERAERETEMKAAAMPPPSTTALTEGERAFGEAMAEKHGDGTGGGFKKMAKDTDINATNVSASMIKRLFAPSWYSRPTHRDEPRAPRTPGGVNLQPRSIVRYDDDYED